MRFLIVGAGAIGCMIGAHLVRAGHRVAFVARPATGRALAASGITLDGAGPPQTVRAFDLLERVQSLHGQGYDWILLATKAYDLQMILQQLAAGGPSGTVVTLQNGIGSEALAAAFVGPDRVVAASVTIPVERLGPTRFRIGARGGLLLAPWSASGPAPQPLARALSAAALPTAVTASARAMKWSKLLYNQLGNATSAILALPPERIFRHTQLYQVEVAALRESRAVMRALDLPLVSLPGYPARWQIPPLVRLPSALTQPVVAWMMGRSRGGKMPSLYLDLEAGRSRSEVAVLNGAVARVAATLGVPAPVNDGLACLLTALVRRERPVEHFRGRPAALLAALDFPCAADP